MYNPKTQALFYYWMGLRQNRRAPYRKDIEPRQIKKILPNLFILEYLDFDHTVFRLAGTAICERYGREFRAHNFLSLWRGDDKIQMRELINTALMDATPTYASFRGETIDRLAVDCELLLLPMMDDKGSMNRIMGCTHVVNNSEVLKNRKIVNQWLTSCEYLNSNAMLNNAYNQAPRPMRVDKPKLTLIDNSLTN
jgi:hypothetical protein